MSGPGTTGPLAALARLRQSPPATAGERCEMCASDIGGDHSHLVDLRKRTLVCACRACYLLFTLPGAGGGRYRVVPDRYRVVPDFELSSAQWERLQIPVAVAFFFRNSATGAVSAFFPGPAGATECLLPLDTWSEVEAANPVIAAVEPDVEAVLVRTHPGGSGERAECYLVPIDACYQLVGVLRSRWRGFDGGQQAHDAMAAFFRGVRERSRGAMAGA